MVGDYRVRYSRRSSADSVDSDDNSTVEGETTSSVYSAGKESMATEWTDEKHSLYLKSMEASFVDQLYNSLGFLGNKENAPSSRFGGSTRKTCQEQFKVLHDGFWQKISVKEPEYCLKGRHHGGSHHEFLRSPWIKHYKPLPKSHIPVTGEASSKPGINGKKGYSSASRDWDQISCIGQEVSDQNFVNEVTKGENGSSKKMKNTLMTGSSSSTDQVVPLRKTPAT